MNRKFVLGLTLMVMAMVSACAPRNKAEKAEDGFEAIPVDGGKAAVIIKYTGAKWAVKIPGEIQKLPVTQIRTGAFHDKNIISVTIPKSVTSIGNDAFRNNQLTKVSIPNKVASIGDGAFAENQLTAVTIGNGVTSIGEKAFHQNQLTGITIPDSVTTIGNDAFWGNQLTSVSIGSGVTAIGEWAFLENQLISINIPDSVTAIGDGAFSQNPGLTAVNVSADNPNYRSIEGVLYDKTGATLIHWPAGKTGTVSIPGGVTVIGNYAFRENQLTGVNIPKGISSIGRQAFRSNQLTNITIPDSVTEIGDRAFEDNPLTSITIGANVNLTTAYNSSSFGKGFEDVYIYYHGRRAGTYTRPDTESARWSRAEE